ncbi:MAG: NUDIX pyrophosphatase [Candidatus Paceibacterota bacterium]|jgi:dATP pyrophosphohydrolase
MKTNKQVEIIIFKKVEKELFFLILKRSPRKGGFWQPITGGIEEKETFEEAATREIGEEIGVISGIKLIDIGYSFEFFDHGENHFEKVFAVEVKPETKIVISEEHTEFKWVSGQVAIDQFLKYEKNKEGFKNLIKFLNQIQS